MNEWDFAVVGIHGNVYNWLVYGTVNGVIHSEIASYAYFQNACLKHLKLFGWTHIWSGKIQSYVADSERCPKTGGWENKGKKGRK